MNALVSVTIVTMLLLAWSLLSATRRASTILERFDQTSRRLSEALAALNAAEQERADIDQALEAIYGEPLADLVYLTRLDAIRDLRRKGPPKRRVSPMPWTEREPDAAFPTHDPSTPDGSLL